MSKKIRVAIAGVGNCASSLVQGIEYYRDADPDDTRARSDACQPRRLPRRRRRVRGRLRRRRGQGRPRPRQGHLRRPEQHHPLRPGRRPGRDGAARPDLRRARQVLPRRPSRSRRSSRSTWPTCCGGPAPTCSSPTSRSGREEAQKHYAQACLDAKVAFVNAIPVFIASDPEWAQKFTDAGVPIVGDDIKSQVGATIVHRILARLFEDRGLVLDRTYQLNVGGNMDFKNMLERERLESKKISKTQSVTSQLDNGIDADDVHIGPSDHVAWLDDRKWAYIRLEGRNFGDVPLNVELKLEVWDSPNSAGVIIDALRCAKLALDRGIGGPLLGPVRLLHEVAAGAVPRRRGPPAWSRSSPPAEAAGFRAGC